MKEVFYINMKLINLVKINNIFKPDMKFGDIQVGYKVMKLHRVSFGPYSLSGLKPGEYTEFNI